MHHLSDHARALVATLVFCIFGAAIFWWGTLDWLSTAPLILIYADLLANTYFSILTFAPIAGNNKLQQFLDLVLGLLYIMLPVNANDPRQFALLAVILFGVAVLKYALLARLSGYSKLLERKIIIDAMGGLAANLALGAIILGFPEIGLWAWASLFTLVNVWILWLKPLYRMSPGQAAKL